MSSKDAHSPRFQLGFQVFQGIVCDLVSGKRLDDQERQNHRFEKGEVAWELRWMVKQRKTCQVENMADFQPLERLGDKR